METQNTIPDSGADAGKITFTPKNYFKPNTPKGIQVVGDIMLIAGGIAGMRSWLITYPIDTLKTRKQLYQTKTYNELIQMGNLYKGLTITLLKASSR